MSFTDAIKTCLNKYVDFTGRARRSEYWYFVVFNLLVRIVLGIIDGILFSQMAQSGYGPLSSLAGLALLLPGLAVTARRLHDTDRSGWWMLLGFVPIVGWIVLIIWYATAGTPGPNRFGEDPKRATSFGSNPI
jgi:uncharacterized membrane protein YhaH (DUF805 family)